MLKKVLQHWDACLVGWIVFFDPRGNAKVLANHLVLTVKAIVKFNPVFTFKLRKIFN